MKYFPTVNAILLLSSMLSIATCSAYVVPNPVLPDSKRIAWLNEMTDSFCSTAPGKLSNEMLDTANQIMVAWARMDSKECAIKVEEMVKRVVDERNAGNTDAIVTLTDYNLLIEGWARSRCGTAAAERCEQILTQLEEHPDTFPNRESFKAVLLAWQHSKDSNAANRAQRILEKMIYDFLSGENRMACPDSECFDIVLQLWSRSGLQDAPQRTEQLILAMERLYDATGVKSLQPKTSSFNSVLTAWLRAEDPETLKHVSDLIEFMETHAKLGDTSIEPDMVSYSAYAATLARWNCNPEEAERLLKKVEGRKNLFPGKVFYNTIISCWSRSALPNSYRRARSVLDRQMNHYVDTDDNKCKPDVYGFTSVLASCAMERKEKQKAFQVGLSTFQQLKNSDEYGSPNHVTYGTMLKCCALLLQPSNPLRQKWTKSLMLQCIEDGCVGEMVMSRFREAASPELFQEVMKGVNKKNLPSSWTSNVNEKRNSRKKRNNISARANKR
mmetsp:Transcript_29895/g.45303  ORF Transcript_29895/g.45303 Transcript_29895/m.45303 type:complete len:499 (-) Transcript_29895:60-1556(-)